MNKIELLAPAKNLEYGIAAIDAGADAVYIGAAKFGARAEAGNSIEDISELIDYAHRYLVRVYVAINTLFYDNELAEVEQLIRQLHEAGADAIIIQDMSILTMDLPPIDIHLSTQCNSFDFERIEFFDRLGLKRIVLARELSLGEVRKISDEVSSELEFFVHGALCVGMSGRCYLSEYIGGRSGNRGDCAQPCRKLYDLRDSSGKTVSKDHLLSIKDLNLSGKLEELIDAGVSSLKIEGRLKDLFYLKNVVSYYRRELDRILGLKEDSERSSSGRSYPKFTPDLNASFNRGYTGYFIEGRTDKINSFDTPKFRGEKLGRVARVYSDHFTLKGNAVINNGDGLAFEKNGILSGLKVNSTMGENIYPFKMNGIYTGATIWRNHDHKLYNEIIKEKTYRKVRADFRFYESEEGFSLEITDEDGFCTRESLKIEKEISKSGKSPTEMIEKQLGKLGNTIYEAGRIGNELEADYHIPISEVNELRRRVVDLNIKKRMNSLPVRNKIQLNLDIKYYKRSAGYLENITNKRSEEFYRSHGVSEIQRLDGFNFSEGTELMKCRMCIKYELELCTRYFKDAKEVTEPLYLVDGNKRFELDFHCDECFMSVKSTG